MEFNDEAPKTIGDVFVEAVKYYHNHRRAINRGEGNIMGVYVL